MSNRSGDFYEFGPFRLEPAERLLLRQGIPLSVPPKAFAALVILVERSGHVVGKEELMSALWPETFVEENNLTQCIFTLRRLLDEKSGAQTFIETVPRLGYRFVGPVSRLGAPDLHRIAYVRHSHARIVVREEEELEERDTDAGTSGIVQGSGPGEDTDAPGETTRGLVQDGQEKLGVRRLWGRSRARWLAVMIVVSLAVAAVAAFQGGGWRGRPWSNNNQVQIRSLAVLPLENVSGDATQEYFSDGMTDTLITDLARVDGLRVISRGSIMQYKGARKPVAQIARELGVDAIVEGTVFRSGDRVRINAQLIEARSDKHLWAQSYERDLRDVLAMQNQLAWAITREIKVKLTPEQQRRLTAAPSVDPEAYQLYLRGQYMLNSVDEPSLRKAAWHFEASIAKDPTYAPAHAALAWTYSNLAVDGYEPTESADLKIKAERDTALELDPTLAEIHLLQPAKDWDWTGDEREIKRALELNPNSVDAHAAYANHLWVAGHPDEGIEEMRRAQELDPANPQMLNFVGNSFVYAQRYDEGINYFKKALELDPNHLPTHGSLAWAYALAGKRDEAKAEYDKTRSLMAPRKALILDAWLVPADLILGKREEALKDADWWSKQAASRNVDGYWLGAFYAQLGKKEKAFHWLEKGFQQRSVALPMLKVSRDFPDDMRSDPRYHDLLRRMHLEP